MKKIKIIPVRNYFNDIAKDYDRFYKNTLSITENNNVKMQLLHELQQLKINKIADFGCGTGLYSDMFPDELVTGLDISEKMIAVAKKKHPGNKFIVGDMVSTGLPSNEFDAVVSLFGSVSYVYEQRELFNEIRRILKPGGKIYLMYYNRYSWENMRHGFARKRIHSIRYSNGYDSSCSALFMSRYEILNLSKYYFIKTKCEGLGNTSVINKALPHTVVLTGEKE